MTNNPALDFLENLGFPVRILEFLDFLVGFLGNLGFPVMILEFLDFLVGFLENLGFPGKILGFLNFLVGFLDSWISWYNSWIPEFPGRISDYKVNSRTRTETAYKCYHTAFWRKMCMIKTGWKTNGRKQLFFNKKNSKFENFVQMIHWNKITIFFVLKLLHCKNGAGKITCGHRK